VGNIEESSDLLLQPVIQLAIIEHMFPSPDELERHTDEVTARLREVASQISRLQAEQAALIAELDDTIDFGMTTAQWVAWQAGLMPGEARRAVRLASRLSGLPQLREAFAEGRLSEATVDTLSSVATPANEAELIETSKVATGAQLSRLVRTMAKLTPEGDDPVPVRDEHLSFGHDDNGQWWLRGSLRPEWGAQVETALRAAQDIDHEPGTPLISHAEALARVAEGFIDNTATAGTDIPDRYQVIVRIDKDTLGDVDGHIHGADHCEAHTIDELLCEAYLSVVVQDHGRPVTTASPGRFATPEQRRALIVRDGGCRFPGCGRTRFLKAHHLIRHTDGGPTSLDNMILLCQQHHTLIHKPGWQLTEHPDGHLAFVDPKGRDHATPIQRPPPTGPPPPQPGPRHTGTGERLTPWGTDVILHNWLTATQPDAA